MPWSRLSRFFGDGMVIPPLMTGIRIMGPYKPLRTWVDEFIPYYMEISWEFRLDPIRTYQYQKKIQRFVVLGQPEGEIRGEFGNFLLRL